MINVANQERIVDVTEAAFEECPVSIMARVPEMVVIANEVTEMGWVGEKHASPYGPDSNKWPSKWYDLVRMADIENFKVESAKDKIRDLMKG